VKVKCSRCNREKKISEFYKNIRKSNGVESQCKSCVLKKKKEKYERNIRNKNRRNNKESKVMDLSLCTVETLFITRPENINRAGLEGIVGDLLCQWGERESLKVSRTQG
jgi:hypothetical protein